MYFEQEKAKVNRIIRLLFLTSSVHCKFSAELQDLAFYGVQVKRPPPSYSALTQCQTFCCIISSNLQEQFYQIEKSELSQRNHLSDVISLEVAKLKFKPVLSSSWCYTIQRPEHGVYSELESLLLELEDMVSNLCTNSLYFKNLNASTVTPHLKAPAMQRIQILFWASSFSSCLLGALMDVKVLTSGRDGV